MRVASEETSMAALPSDIEPAPYAAELDTGAVGAIETLPVAAALIAIAFTGGAAGWTAIFEDALSWPWDRGAFSEVR